MQRQESEEVFKSFKRLRSRVPSRPILAHGGGKPVHALSGLKQVQIAFEYLKAPRRFGAERQEGKALAATPTNALSGLKQVQIAFEYLRAPRRFGAERQN